MNDLNVEWLGRGSLNDLHFTAIPLVRLNEVDNKHKSSFSKKKNPYPDDRIHSPIRPIHLVFENSNGEWMGQEVVTS